MIYSVDTLPLQAKDVGIFTFVLATAAAFLYGRYKRSPWRHLPPGPKGLPLVGNIFLLFKDQWLTFTEMRKTHGDLVYLNVAGQPLMVINSTKVAADLLDKRATIYSDRPRNIVASEIMTGGLLVVFTRYSDVWRRMRRAAHESLNKGIVHKYTPVQYLEGVILTSGLLARPQEWDRHLRRTAASAIISMVYDKEPILDEKNPTIHAVNDFVARLTRAAIPGAHFVEFFSWMKYLPASISPWKNRALEWYKKDYAMFSKLYLDLEHRIKEGDERPSIAGSLVRETERNKLTEKENVWLAGTMFAAGAETTSAVLAWWMLAMLAYPETQKRAQEELDRVVGRERLPNFGDLDQLTYIRAMAKESLRWRPVDPVGLPHKSTEDDWYNGYFIPAGSIIVANVWHLNRDPEIHGVDAHEFNPARHLDESGGLAPGPVDTKEESHFTYGFGRRICVGRHVANNSLFIDIAIMLWACNLERPLDEKGIVAPLDVDGWVDDGLVVRPIPFEVKISPRFSEASAMIEAERLNLDDKAA